jgi:c-di-GMP-binding flagellar brake protein YcgR
MRSLKRNEVLFTGATQTKRILPPTMACKPSNLQGGTSLRIETRLHPRISVNWHAFIKTLEGQVTLKTKDISGGGACILYPPDLELEQRFSIYLKPPGAKSIRVIAETVWSDKSNSENREVFRMGVRFLAIFPEDRQFIETLVEKEE